MFLGKYISQTKFELLCENYEAWYLNGLNEEDFLKVYNIFRKYNFYFIDDIILNYIELFELEENEVEDKILSLKNKLGENFVYIIGNDMRYLEELID